MADNNDEDIWEKWANDEGIASKEDEFFKNSNDENVSDEEDVEDVEDIEENKVDEKVEEEIEEKKNEFVQRTENENKAEIEEDEEKNESISDEDNSEEKLSSEDEELYKSLMKKSNEIKEKNEEESDEEEEEDNNTPLDLSEVSEEYSAKNNDGIDFDDLNDYDSSSNNVVTSNSNANEGSKESNFSGNSKKTTFDALNNVQTSRSPFKPGRLNSNYFFVAGGIIALLLISMFGVQKKLSSNGKAKDEAKVEEDMNTSGGMPDFGNYEERRYVETQADKNKKDIDYINQSLTVGNKTPYQATPVTQTQGSVQQTSGYVSSSWQDARDASLRYSGSGFGSKNVSTSPIDALTSGGNGLSNGVNPTMSKAEYAQNYLSNLGNISNAVSGNNSGGLSGYDIVNNGRYSNAGAYDKNNLGGNISGIPSNSIFPGTVLQAVLVSGINTDYPGTITARITSPVYDSQYGQTLLIPQGSILRGSYSSSSIGIAKVQIAWESLIINRDGMTYTVNLGSMVGVDKKGYSGIKGTLNDHWFQYIRAAGMSALFTMINYNIYSYSNARNSKVQQEMIGEAQSVGQSLADKLLERALDIQPTVVVKPGTRVNVDVDTVLTLIPLNRDETVERYIRK